MTPSPEPIRISFMQRKKEFIYSWTCPSGNIYYIQADNSTQARLLVLARQEVELKDAIFIRAKIPQNKWCRQCVKDKQWLPYVREFYKESAG